MRSRSDRKCVLVVAETEGVSTVLREAGESCGHDVLDAGSAREALFFALSWQPRVVCVDLRLPLLSAYDVALRIAAAFGSKRPLLVAITSPGATINQEKAREAGFDFVVSMDAPWALRELLGSDEKTASPPPPIRRAASA